MIDGTCRLEQSCPSNPSGRMYTTMNTSIVGKRLLGRPKTRWIDWINKVATELHAETEVGEAAKDLRGL